MRITDLIQLTVEQESALTEDLEIDVAFSEKIPKVAREDGLRTILFALRRSLLERRDAANGIWDDLQSGRQPFDDVTRWIYFKFWSESLGLILPLQGSHRA